ncbi:hypothetical protein ACFLZM_01125 [Thermodesulfobacteriota bacterium]
MIKRIILWASMVIFLAPGLSLAQAPHQLAGFILDADIERFIDKVQPSTSLPIRYMEYIKEVEIQPIEGFKSGLIGYGDCTISKPIVRIKLKCADSSKTFFEKLLKRFKQRFGEPSEWRGDPFHIYLAWKWSFKDKDQNRISLTISHNTKDSQEKMGNAIKLTMTNRLEEERLCFEKKQPEFRKHGQKKPPKKESKEPVDWNLYIPR